MSVKWYRRKWAWGVAALAGVFAVTEAGLVLSGERVLIGSTIVHPRQTLVLPGYGNVGSKAQSSLVCRYFTGRGIATDVIRYSATNRAGRDECPFYAVRRNGEAGGSAADWVSGIGSLLAVIAALFGYFLVEKKHRKDDREKLQGQIYQIGFKLSTMASEVRTTLRDLNQKSLPIDELLAEDDPFVICGTQAGVIGYDRTMVRELSDAEQNLLMLLREEDFLMNFGECVARNESVRSSFVEYGRRRDDVLARLPSPDQASGQVGSIGLTEAQRLAIFPYVVPTAMAMRQARYLAKLNVDMVVQLCEDFMPMMKRHYPKMHVHKIELLELPPGSPAGL
ncbi:hypothetical protein [Sphingobium lactosutens]|uniref:Uncharacterized protein n=1 Tax=Sphingobium lactosutens DS20 TaxID=1331060 RepID=T0INM7_9SPHN|nr:hypothetical protein [Sphingobium lactosutens]EQB11249.1 hypothetical protein RLDS_22875 [Sphingobium lactosutens DS20]